MYKYKHLLKMYGNFSHCVKKKKVIAFLYLNYDLSFICKFTYCNSNFFSELDVLTHNSTFFFLLRIVTNLQFGLFPQFISRKCDFFSLNSDFITRSCKLLNQNGDKLAILRKYQSFPPSELDFITHNCEFISHNSEKNSEKVTINFFFFFSVGLQKWHIQGSTK